MNALNLLLFSSEDKKIKSEFSISFEYESFTQKLFFLEKQEKYKEGMWISYRTFQNEDLINHQIFSVKASLFTPIIGEYLYSGIEIGVGVPTKSWVKRYDVPALTYDLTGTVSSPFEGFIEENYSQKFNKEIDIYLIPVLFKSKLILPLGKQVKLSTGIGIGPKFIIENIKNTIINTYTKDYFLYNKDEETSSTTKESKFYLIPYCEGLIGLNFLISPRISIGLNAKIGYIFPSDFANDETDFQQTEWWPEEEKLIKFRSGNLYEGINLSFGVEIKMYI